MINPALAVHTLSGQGASTLRRDILVLPRVMGDIVGAKVPAQIWRLLILTTLGTFAVLAIGATYGDRLGQKTIFACLMLAASSASDFAGSFRLESREPFHPEAISAFQRSGLLPVSIRDLGQKGEQK